MNPRYQAWIEAGRPGFFMTWIPEVIRWCFNTGSPCVERIPNKYYSEPQLRVCDHKGLDDACWEYARMKRYNITNRA